MMVVVAVVIPTRSLLSKPRLQQDRFATYLNALDELINGLINLCDPDCS